MRKLSIGIVALLFASALAWATNIPLYTGPIQPANLVDLANNLITKINADTPGLNSFIPGPITSAATTNEQTLASYSIPAGTLVSAGQSLRFHCGGATAANTNTKTVHLYFGSIELSSASFSSSAENWELELLVSAATTPATANTVYIGRGSTGTATVAPISSSDTTDNVLTGSILAKCTVTQGSASAGDTILYNFIAEQVK